MNAPDGRLMRRIRAALADEDGQPFAELAERLGEPFATVRAGVFALYRRAEVDICAGHICLTPHASEGRWSA